MVRFYDSGVYYFPAWLRELLHKCIEPLRAEEAIYDGDANRAANYVRDDWLKWLREKQRQARPRQDVDIIYVSPQHAAWFEANGIPHQLLPENDTLKD